MKKITVPLLSIIFFFALTSSVLFISCSKPSCEGISCKNGGTCADGTCSCPAGWEGQLCETFSTTNYLRTFNATDSYGSGVDTYQTTISDGSGDSIVISRMSNGSYYNPVKAVLNGNKFEIHSQYDGFQYISGSGTIGYQTIAVSYTITIPQGTSSPIVRGYTGIWD